MRFQAEIRAALGWRWSDGATFDARLDYARQWRDEHGTGCEAAWSAEHETLPDGHYVTLDLANLVRNVLGDMLVTSLSGVHVLLVVNHAPDGGVLHVGGAASNAWRGPLGDGPLAVAPDGALLLATRAVPWPVEAAHRNLQLAAADGDVQYSIALLGITPGAASGGT